MKFLVFLVAFAAVAIAADVPTCQVTQLKSLTENPNVPLCVTKSGVVFSTLQSTPTDAQLARMCATSECVALLGAIVALDPADCTLPVDGGIALRSQLVDPAVAYCKKSGVQVATTGSSSGGGGASVGTVKAADVTSSNASAAANTTKTTASTPAPSSGATAHALGAASSVVTLIVAAAAML